MKIMDHRANRFGTKSRERTKQIEKPTEMISSVTPGINGNEPNMLRLSKNGSINQQMALQVNNQQSNGSVVGALRNKDMNATM